MNAAAHASGEPEAPLNCDLLSTGPEDSDNDDLSPLRCWDCDVNFTTKLYLYDHLLHHVKQPRVSLQRCQLPPLRLTLKSAGSDSFQIVESPSPGGSPTTATAADALLPTPVEELTSEGNEAPPVEFANVDGPKVDDGSECGSIPGAEPTPPPEPNSDLPKIRIKTTGLLKEALSITEIDADDVGNENDKDGGSWGSSTPAEDPLKLPGTDDILSLFNNNERAKDFGFTTSDSEFIPLDRLGDRNGNALPWYN